MPGTIVVQSMPDTVRFSPVVAGGDGMAFALQRTDHVEREKHDGAVRAAVKAQIALTIAVETLLGDQRLEHAALRHAAARRIDRFHPPGTRSFYR